MRQKHRRNRVSMVRHPAAHQGYRRSRHAPSRNGLTRQHPERRLSSTLLLEKQSTVDNNRRYVSPRIRRKPFTRASAGIFPGQIFQKEVSLPTLLTYRRLMSTKGVFREEGVAFTCLSPIKKAKQPHTSFPPAPSARSFVRALVPACSYIPAPVPHPRVFGLPSALAPSPCVLGSSRPRPAYGSFGSSQHSPFHHVPAPFCTLAILAPTSRLPFPLLRLPRARFSALPLHIPLPVFHARSLGIPCKSPVASAIQSPRFLLFLAYLLHAIYCFLAIIRQILDGNSAAIAIFLTGI